MIRHARPDDFAAVAAITNHYIERTAIHFGLQPTTAEDQREAWVAMRCRYPYLVACADGAVVGYAKAGPWRDRPAYAWTPECGVYVQHDRLGSGLGTALYARLLMILERQGFCSVMAGITLPNAASVRLHERFGFISTGVVRRAGWKFGQWWDVGFWQRDLLPGGQSAGPLRAVDEADQDGSELRRVGA